MSFATSILCEIRGAIDALSLAVASGSGPTAANCNGDNASLSYDPCTVAAINALAAQLATSQSSIETAIGALSTAVVTAVDTAADDVEAAIAAQTTIQSAEAAALLADIGNLRTDVQAGNTTLSSLLTQAIAIETAINALDLPVDLSSVVDAIAAQKAALETILTAIKTDTASIADNTDEVETKLDTVIANIQTGNASLAGIKTDTAAILVDLAKLDANTDGIEQSLIDILAAINAADHTDDDIRAVAPQCYIGDNGPFVGYMKVKEDGTPDGWEVLSGTAPTGATVTCAGTGTIVREMYCVEIDGVNAIAYSVTEVTAQSTTLLRVETESGTVLVAGTGAGEYTSSLTCDCDTPRA